MEYSEWFLFFLMDQGISLTEILYEGIYKNRYIKITYLDFVRITERQNLLNKNIRTELSRKSLVGEDIKPYLKKVTERMTDKSFIGFTKKGQLYE